MWTVLFYEVICFYLSSFWTHQYRCASIEVVRVLRVFILIKERIEKRSYTQTPDKRSQFQPLPLTNTWSTAQLVVSNLVAGRNHKLSPVVFVYPQPDRQDSAPQSQADTLEVFRSLAVVDGVVAQVLEHPAQPEGVFGAHLNDNHFRLVQEGHLMDRADESSKKCCFPVVARDVKASVTEFDSEAAVFRAIRKSSVDLCIDICLFDRCNAVCSVHDMGPSGS